MKKYIFTAAIFALLLLVGCGKKEVPEPILQEEPVVVEEETPENPIQNFEDCLRAGFPVMESYPRQCNDGTTTYVEEIPLLSGTNETGTTNTGDNRGNISGNQDLTSQTGATASGSKIDVIAEYIEKLREKKYQDGVDAPTPKSIPEKTPTQVPVSPTPPDIQATLPQQPAQQDDAITEQDIENMEKILDEIVK